MFRACNPPYSLHSETTTKEKEAKLLGGWNAAGMIICCLYTPTQIHLTQEGLHLAGAWITTQATLTHLQAELVLLSVVRPCIVKKRNSLPLCPL